VEAYRVVTCVRIPHCSDNCLTEGVILSALRAGRVLLCYWYSFLLGVEWTLRPCASPMTSWLETATFRLVAYATITFPLPSLNWLQFSDGSGNDCSICHNHLCYHHWTDYNSCLVKKLRGPQYESELYRLSDCHLSTKFNSCLVALINIFLTN
jgi:hypothetical protein